MGPLVFVWNVPEELIPCLFLSASPTLNLKPRKGLQKNLSERPGITYGGEAGTSFCFGASS